MLSLAHLHCVVEGLAAVVAHSVDVVLRRVDNRGENLGGYVYQSNVNLSAPSEARRIFNEAGGRRASQTNWVGWVGLA